MRICTSRSHKGSYFKDSTSYYFTKKDLKMKLEDLQLWKKPAGRDFRSLSDTEIQFAIALKTFSQTGTLKKTLAALRQQNGSLFQFKFTSTTEIRDVLLESAPREDALIPTAQKELSSVRAKIHDNINFAAAIKDPLLMEERRYKQYQKYRRIEKLLKISIADQGVLESLPEAFFQYVIDLYSKGTTLAEICRYLHFRFNLEIDSKTLAAYWNHHSLEFKQAAEAHRERARAIKAKRKTA